MGLSRYKFKELLQESFRKNQDLEFDISYVRGISNNKQITLTKANVDEAVIRKFYVVNRGEFVYNPRTTRMGDKVGLGFNNTETPLLFSFNNIAFFINEFARNIILSEYLYMYFNRPEFDRYAMIHGWGSATELFSFEEMCDMDIDLPPLAIQKKYVNVYNAMVANQKAYERGLEDLKLTCDAYIEDLRRRIPCERIGKYLIETKQKNETAETLPNRSVSNKKVFIDAKEAIVNGVDTKNYMVVESYDFAYNTVTTRNADKLSIALNTSEKCLVSPLYTTFRVAKEGLLPEYLCLWFNRSEYDRHARFESWGSARELYPFDTLANTKIPIPDVSIQQSVVNILTVYNTRKAINEKLKAQIKSICPILIKGSIEEGRNTKEA